MTCDTDHAISGPECNDPPLPNHYYYRGKSGDWKLVGTLGAAAVATITAPIWLPVAGFLGPAVAAGGTIATSVAVTTGAKAILENIDKILHGIKSIRPGGRNYTLHSKADLINYDYLVETPVGTARFYAVNRGGSYAMQSKVLEITSGTEKYMIAANATKFPGNSDWQKSVVLQNVNSGEIHKIKDPAFVSHVNGWMDKAVDGLHQTKLNKIRQQQRQ
jgi:hypothetical protein